MDLNINSFKEWLENCKKKRDDFKKKHATLDELIRFTIEFAPTPFDKFTDKLWNGFKDDPEGIDKIIKILEITEQKNEQGFKDLKNQIAQLNQLPYTDIEIKKLGEQIISSEQSISTMISCKYDELNEANSKRTEKIVGKVDKAIEEVGNLKILMKNMAKTHQDVNPKSGEKIEESHIFQNLKITKLWNKIRSGELKVGDYVNIQGTISKYLPFVLGDPMDKIDTHLAFRRKDLQKHQSENPLVGDSWLAFTAGQMVWRPKIEEDYIPLGLYQSIVRNSLPVYVKRDYFNKKIDQMFDKFSNNVIDAEIKGKLISINYSFESQFTGQKEFQSFVEERKSQLYAIWIEGDENSWIKNPTETMYLDGDIWIALESKNTQRTISRFLDLSDAQFRFKEYYELKKDWEKEYPDYKLISTFDQIEEIF